MIVQGGQAVAKNQAISGENALGILDNKKAQSTSEPSFSEILKDEIKQISTDWQTIGNDASLLLQSAPSNMRDLFNLQAKVNQLQFQVNTASRIGDTAAQSLKRLQQAQG